MFRSYESKKEFLDLFGRLSAKVRDGSRAFLGYLEDYNNFGPVSLNFKGLEHDADSIAHRINERLYKSYMTPFEPADIQMLAERMDSILDLIVSSQIKLGIFKLKPPLADIAQMAGVLDRAIIEIETIVRSLPEAKLFPAVLGQCADVKALKGQADDLLYELLRTLFSGESDPVELFNRKQIIEQVKEAMDRCGDAADIIEGIILKNG